MNWSKFLKFPAVFILSGCLAACHSGDDKVNLKLNWEPGSQYLYTLSVDQDITTMGIANVKMNMVIDMLYQMFPKDDNLQKLGITYNHFSLKESSAAGSITYDSGDTTNQNTAIGNIGKMIGKTFYIYLNDDGTFKKAEGFSALADSIPGQQQSLFNDSSFAMMMQNSFEVYPGKPVAEGESWKKTTTMGISGFKFNINSTYTLKDVKDGVADVDVKSKLSLPETTLDKGNFKMQIEMDGQQQGNMQLDVASGRIISGTTTQNIEGKMNARGQELPITIKSTTHIQSKKM